MSDRDAALLKLGFPLDRVPAPAGLYRPLVVDGTTAYLSGAIPYDGPGHLPPAFVGKVPGQVPLPVAQQAAALCAANLLRVLRAELGGLDRVARVLKLTGYVHSEPGFSEQHLVVNSASQLLLDVLGEAGAHARAAVGVAQLPLGCAVELDLVVKLT